MSTPATAIDILAMEFARELDQAHKELKLALAENEELRAEKESLKRQLALSRRMVMGK